MQPLSIQTIRKFIETASSSDDDIAPVQELMRQHITADLADFYQLVRATPDIAGFIKSDDEVDRLSRAQRGHWNAIFAEELTPDFEERSRRVGEVHARIGLSTAWYMSAYAWVLIRSIGPLAARFRFQPSRMERVLKTMLSRVFLDMVIATQVYEERVQDGRGADVERETSVRSLKTLADNIASLNELAIDMMQLSSNTREVAGSSQTIAAAAAEMTASVSEISNSCTLAADEATAADRSASDARASVSAVEQAIQNISATVSETAQSIDELSRSSEQIGAILGTIENIARQTKLLALNATIEAARAGDAGRGFGVVAAEVKGLSEQTAKATEDIASRIATLRSGMDSIMRTMEQSARAVEEGEVSIGKATSTMGQVSEQVATVNNKMTEVSRILHQQKAATTEVACSIDRVANLATKNEGLLSVVSGKVRQSNDRFGESVKAWFRVDSHRSLCEMAKVDHILFKKQIVDALDGQIRLTAADLPDHCNCRLGKWYESLAVPEIKELPAFKELFAPHQQVHDSAKKALDAHNQNKPAEALKALQDLQDASAEVLAKLEELSGSLTGALANLDRREHTRMPVNETIEFTIQGAKRSGQLIDISEGGARLGGLGPTDVGKNISIVLDDACYSGTTVWSDGRTGGIKFAAAIPKRLIRRMIKPLGNRGR